MLLVIFGLSYKAMKIHSPESLLRVELTFFMLQKEELLSEKLSPHGQRIRYKER